MEENLIGNVKYPPGIRFCPSDEELITCYLKRKVNYLELPARIIADIDLYKYNPWDLPKMALYGGGYEWYFFTPRDKKYPNGGRPNRTAVSGYWKATGKDIPVLSSSGSRTIGLKKVLVFYRGKPKKGVKMDWVMTEYRLPDTSRPYRSKGCMRLDDWVLCRVRQKGNMSKNTREDDSSSHEFLEDQRKIEELPSVYPDRSRDVFSDHLLSSEFHLMASLLNGSNVQKESFPQTMTVQNAVESESSRFIVAEKDKNSSRQQRGNNFNPIYSYVNFQEFNMPAMADNLLQ